MKDEEESQLRRSPSVARAPRLELPTVVLAKIGQIVTAAEKVDPIVKTSKGMTALSSIFPRS